MPGTQLMILCDSIGEQVNEDVLPAEDTAFGHRGRKGDVGNDVYISTTEIVPQRLADERFTVVINVEQRQ